MTENWEPGRVENPSKLPPPPPPPPEKASFGLTVWAWAVFGVSVVVALVAAGSGQRDREPTAVPAYLFGIAIGMLLATVTPAVIVFYIGGRSRKVASIVFVALSVLGAAGQLRGVVQRRAEQNRASREFDEEIHRVKDEFARDVANGKMTPEEATAKLEKFMAAAGEASKSMGSRDAAAMQAMTRVMAALKDDLQSYGAALDTLSKESPLQPGWIKTREDIVRCRQNIATLQEGTDKMRRRFAGLREQFRSELKAGGVSDSEANAILQKGFAKMDRARPIFLAMRDEDDIMLAQMRKATDLLERDWDKWKVDVISGLVLFEKTESGIAFDEIVSKVQEAADRQAKEQREYIDMVK